jgi:hypothetical protein
MGKMLKGLFSGGAKETLQRETEKAKAEGDRLAEQSKVLNERNAQVEGETRASRSGRRGRRMLAYKGQETGLRGTLGVAA